MADRDFQRELAALQKRMQKDYQELQKLLRRIEDFEGHRDTARRRLDEIAELRRQRQNSRNSKDKK